VTVSAGRSQGEPGGREDFDFLRGQWTVHNRRLAHPLEPDSTEWQEFTTEVENRPIFGGLGNIDLYRSAEFPAQRDWEALALRLFDPDQSVWRIWWASTASPGQLDNPVEGVFADGRGVFRCDDVLGGRAVKVEYEWSGTSGAQPRWGQAFSFDAGQTWHTDWIMDWRREGVLRA
jgi:hypothetical protein